MFVCVCLVVVSVPVSVPCPSSLHDTQPSFTTAAAVSQLSHSQPVCSSPPSIASPPAVPLIEHLRRLKHGMPTSPLLAASLSTSTMSEPFQTSHGVGLKDLLLGSDEVTGDRTAAAAIAEKLTQSPFTRHSSPLLASPAVAAAYGLTDPRIFDVSGRPLRPAIILKQLLEDRSEPVATSPSVSEPLEVISTPSRGVGLDPQVTGSASGSSSTSELMFGYNNPLYDVSRGPSSLTPSNQVQPPFVQLVTSVEDTLGIKQSLPSTQPLTFSIAELTSVSHLWSPPSFTSSVNSVDQIATSPPSLHQSQTSDIQSLMTVASSPSLGIPISGSGLQLKVAAPRMAPSRNVLLRVSI